jgi:hypothetical protein
MENYREGSQSRAGPLNCGLCRRLSRKRLEPHPLEVYLSARQTLDSRGGGTGKLAE